MEIRFIEKEDVQDFVNRAHDRIGETISVADLLQEIYLEANNAEEHYDYKLYVNMTALGDYIVENFKEEANDD